MKVVGFGGQLASGKDTAADYVADRLNEMGIRAKETGYPVQWAREAFANAVKKVFEDAFAVDREFIEEWKRKDECPDGFIKPVRQSLQFIGDGFRQIRSDIWIETAFREKNAKVLSDVRYINEGKAISEHDGLSVLVWRPGFENDDPNPSESQIKPLIDWCVESGQEGPINLNQCQGPVCNIPPAGIEWFDLFIKNDGTVDDLYKKLDEIIIPFIVRKYTA